MIGDRPPGVDRSLGWWYAGWGQAKDGAAERVLGVRALKVYPLSWSCPPGPYHFVDGSFDERCAAFHYWRFHQGAAHFAFADGSVRLLS